MQMNSRPNGSELAGSTRMKPPNKISKMPNNKFFVDWLRITYYAFRVRCRTNSATPYANATTITTPITPAKIVDTCSLAKPGTV